MSLGTTTQSQSFAGEIVEGQKLKINSPAWYRTCLRKYKVGTKLTITLTDKRPKRTEAQNNYYWGVYIPLIAEHTGEDDFDALHELFKGMFLSQGIKTILGRQVRKKGSTTSLSVSGFSEYIRNIERLTGVLAPPTEDYGLAPLKE